MMQRARCKYAAWHNISALRGASLSISKEDLTLIALWNGEEGGGPGATKKMVASQARGARYVYLDGKRLLE